MSTIAIIGAGMGGLVAGNLLVKKGHKVTIFES
ncbi:MAG: NAD(P)-binding protein, partial [candidate division WOR-3 bacterium]